MYRGRWVLIRLVWRSRLFWLEGQTCRVHDEGAMRVVWREQLLGNHCDYLDENGHGCWCCSLLRLCCFCCIVVTFWEEEDERWSWDVQSDCRWEISYKILWMTRLARVSQSRRKWLVAQVTHFLHFIQEWASVLCTLLKKLLLTVSSQLNWNVSFLVKVWSPDYF